MMEYSEVPIPVREWIEDQERNEGQGKGLFAVYEKPSDADDKILNVVKFPSKGMAPALRPLDQKKVVLFAPGAVYDILPLWVAEGSKCKGVAGPPSPQRPSALGVYSILTISFLADTLLDMAKYSPKLSDGGVVAWPVKYTRANRKRDERAIEFTIQAQVLGAKPEKTPEKAKDEL